MSAAAAITYRSLLSFPGPPGALFQGLDEQLRPWLASKSVPWDGGLVGASRTNRTTVEALEHRERDQSRTNLVRVVDRTPTGTWTVRLTAHAPARSTPWLLTEVLSPQQDESARVVAGDTPRVLRQLLEVLPGRDGNTRSTAAPALICADEAATVVAAVLDPERRGPIYVAGTPEDFPLDTWQHYIARLVSGTVGLAASFVLDAEATALVRAELGSHGPDRGYLRTYLRDVQLGDAADAARHRFLTPRTMTERPEGYLRRVLAGTARRQVVDRPLPPAVVRVLRLAARWETSDAPETVSTLSTSPMPRPADDQLARLRELEAQAARLQEQLDGVELELLRRDEQLESLQAELEQAQLDGAVALDDAHAKDDQVRYLRTRLTQVGEGETAWSEVPEEQRTRLPESVSELLERLDELTYVVFTGDQDTALELDVTDNLGRSARKAWQAMLALEDYARLTAQESYTGTVHDYCRETPGGCNGWSAERHAPDESGPLKSHPRLAALRQLPVPAHVDPSGRVFMGAHFKLAAHRAVSPRMHYYDDTSGTGKVYVGYLGRHLPNSQTN